MRLGLQDSSTNPHAVYYESDDVLVKVEGSDMEYQDTAPGATDDGMGVATLLSMFHGASVGQDHRYFLNLEGAVAGGANELSIDATGGGTVPTITVEDVDKAANEEQEKSGSATPSLPAIPREYPSGVAPVIPDWYKVGWCAVANIDAPPLEEGEEKDKHILSFSCLSNIMASGGRLRETQARDHLKHSLNL
ncbi:hypothetical protein DFH29DRAFT_1022258, partial [Suillus ampliporus]